MSTTTVKHLYSDRANERRRQFDRLIDRCDLVLMNNIVEIDPDIFINWEHNSLLDNCDIKDNECQYHGVDLEDGECPYQDEIPEVYQWFATSQSDAEFLGRHNQHIAYSDVLDTYFLAVTHFGTAWNYTSMVDDFSDCYTGLADFKDEEKQL